MKLVSLASSKRHGAKATWFPRNWHTRHCPSRVCTRWSRASIGTLDALLLWPAAWQPDEVVDCGLRMEYPADVRQPTMPRHAPSPRQAVVRAADLAQYISVDQGPLDSSPRLGMARSASSAGRWLIIISEETKVLPRPHVRPLCP